MPNPREGLAKEFIMTQDSATSQDTVVQPEKPTIVTSEPSDTSGTENRNQGTDAPAINATGSYDDYLGDASNENPNDGNWEKRYRDSSREAGKYKQRVDAVQTFFNQHPELIEDYKDDLTLILDVQPAGPESKSSDPEVLARLEQLERQHVSKARDEANAAIVKFETDKKITPEQRQQMRTIIRPLVTNKENPIPLAGALQIAWAAIGGASQREQGRLEGLAESLTDTLATYAPIGKSNQAPRTEQVKITEREYRQFKGLGLVDAQGRVSQEALDMLAQKRLQK